MLRFALAAVLALGSFLAGYSTTSDVLTPAPVSAAPSVDTSAPDDAFPVRVTRIGPDTLRVEITGYVDGECEGCTEDQAVYWAETIMSNAIAESLPAGEPLHVGENDAPAYVPAILLDMGWVSDPGDGCECLYPPSLSA